MIKTIIFLLRITYAENGPLVGSIAHEDTRILDAAPHCHLTALEACTTIITAKLCMIKLYFENCEPIAAYGIDRH